MSKNKYDIFREYEEEGYIPGVSVITPLGANKLKEVIWEEEFDMWVGVCTDGVRFPLDSLTIDDDNNN